MVAHGNIKQCNRPTAKVKAATVGSAAGSALGVVICWVLTTAGFAPPTGVEGAIAILCSTSLAGLAGWFKRPNADTRVIDDGQGRPCTGHQIRSSGIHRHRVVRAA
jgi:high-affinity Fe2+/Pb2+ permease